MARSPAQEDDELLQQADESLNENDNPIEIDGVVGDKPAENKAQLSSNVNTDAIARLVAGATPTLMGFLMGASPAMAANQIAQTKQTFEAGKPKKLVMVSGPDGQPVYEDSAMAVGENAYVKPTRAPLGAANSFQFGIGFNKETKKYEQLKANTRTGELLFADNTPITDQRNWIFKPVRESEHVFENIGGGKDLIARNQYIDDAKSKYHSEGIGERLKEPGKKNNTKTRSRTIL